MVVMSVCSRGLTLALYKLVEEAGLPCTGAANHQELEEEV